VGTLDILHVTNVTCRILVGSVDKIAFKLRNIYTLSRMLLHNFVIICNITHIAHMIVTMIVIYVTYYKNLHDRMIVTMIVRLPMSSVRL
jgi:hypothetical protein